MSVIRDTKDAIGPRDTDKDLVLKRVSEKINVEENATRVRTNTYGNSWIVGSSSNGIVGTNTNTQNGLQQVVGGAGRTETVVAVSNPNNTHRERFLFNRFEDTGNTTADWDTTNNQAVIETTEVLQSLSIYLGDDNISQALLTIEGTNTSNATYELSPDGSSNWETVTLGTTHTFTNQGSDLRYRFTASGATVTVTLIKVEYI